jgi:hypothetical protein
MTEIGRKPTPRLPRLNRQRQAGYILLKFGLTLLAIVELAYIGATAFRKYQRSAQRDSYVEEVRALAAVFERFQIQTGSWPAATHADARIPKGMESALAATRWLAGPPFGGTYDWVPPAPAPTEANKEGAGKKPDPGAWIAVTAFSPGPPLPLSQADLIDLDRKLDDGNLATGRFRTGFNGWPIYQVNPGR